MAWHKLLSLSSHRGVVTTLDSISSVLSELAMRYAQGDQTLTFEICAASWTGWWICVRFVSQVVEEVGSGIVVWMCVSSTSWDLHQRRPHSLGWSYQVCCPSVCPQKVFAVVLIKMKFGVLWRSMSATRDLIQGQGHYTLNVRNSSILLENTNKTIDTKKLTLVRCPSGGNVMCRIAASS